MVSTARKKKIVLKKWYNEYKDHILKLRDNHTGLIQNPFCLWAECRMDSRQAKAVPAEMHHQHRLTTEHLGVLEDGQGGSYVIHWTSYGRHHESYRQRQQQDCLRNECHLHSHLNVSVGNV